MTYAELKEQLKTPMELKVGAYRMEVRSKTRCPAWTGNTPSTVRRATLRSPRHRRPRPKRWFAPCRTSGLGGIFVRAGRHAGRHQQGHRIAGRHQPGFPQTETRAAYFKPQALENTLDFVFDGTFADTDVPAKFSKQITGVKAGQWRKVSVVIGHADKGNILFSVKSRQQHPPGQQIRRRRYGKLGKKPPKTPTPRHSPGPGTT